MKKFLKHYSLIIILAISFGLIKACKKKKPEEDSPENYNRKELLTNMANNYIVPAYTTYFTQVEDLKNKTQLFVNSPSISTLDELRNQWKNALLDWQSVAFFEFGPAESLSLRDQTNLFPLDTNIILNNIVSGNYDLQLPANFVAKGFQSLDYLLYRPGFTDQNLIDFYTDNTNAKNYLLAVVEELVQNANTVKNEWQSYSTTFINNNSSNAQGTSVNYLLNAFSFHYETHVRKGKIGLPAGVFNGISQLPMPNHVECFYSKESLPYVIQSMNALLNIFKGTNISTGADGEGFDNYLNFVGAKYNSENLSSAIINQINTIINDLNQLNDPLSDEVVNNQTAVLNVYQNMQKLVPLIKVEMTSALGVLITYQDTDGD